MFYGYVMRDVELSIKKCPKCKQLKSTIEYSKCKSNKDGLQSECKSCSKDRRNNILQRNPTYFLEALKKHLETHKKPSKKLTNPRYIPFPKDSEEYKNIRSTREKESQKRYRDKPEVIEKIKAKRRTDEYRRRNRERYENLKKDPIKHERFVELRKKRSKKFYANNKDYCHAKWHERRLKIRQNDDNVSKSDIKYIYDSQKHKCAICKISIKKYRHIDHIVPIARGGRHNKYNIQLLCPQCNLSKNCKDPIDFMNSLGLLC